MKIIAFSFLALLLISSFVMAHHKPVPAVTMVNHPCVSMTQCYGNIPNKGSDASQSSSGENGYPLVTCYRKDGKKMDLHLKPYRVKIGTPIHPKVKTWIIGDQSGKMKSMEGYEWRVRILDGESLRVVDRLCDGTEDINYPVALPYNYWMKKAVHPDFW